MNRLNRVVVIGTGLTNSQEIGSHIVLAENSKIPKFHMDENLFTGKKYNIAYSEIDDIDVNKYLPNVSTRCIDKITLSSGIAANIAAGKYFSQNTIDPSEVGMTLGTAIGSIVSISGFDLQALTEGPNSVNPIEFPNTVSNAPTSKVGIWLKLKGPSVTISNGFTSSLNAIGFAFDEISYGKANYYLAGGSEELSENVYKGYCSVVIDKLTDSSNISGKEIIGEGSGIFFLSSMEEAVYKECDILGEISDFYSSKINTDGNYIDNIKNIIKSMIDKNGMNDKEVVLYTSYLPFNVFSRNVCDEMLKVYGEDHIIMRNRINDTSINYLGVNGAFNLAYALEDIKRREHIKGALVFDIGCNGEFACAVLKY